MFTLQSLPLSHHQTVMDYVLFLLARWVKPMFALANHVHLVWDHPGRHGASPKDVERRRRDATTEPSTCSHPAANLSLTSPCPTGDVWRKTLSCRTCKRAIVSLLSCGTLLLMKVQDMKDGQVFVTAGGFDGAERDQAWFVDASTLGRLEEFDSNHEEGDTRVWYHACKFKQAVIYSPDTDTFMIRLPLLDSVETKIAVRVDTPGAKDHLYVDMGVLLDCVNRDPDLAPIPAPHRASALQVSYVASGCDFTSFFAGVGKATFFKALFKHATFICDADCDIIDFTSHRSFPGFMRLVAAAYYCKHRSAFNVSLPDLFATLSTSLDQTQPHVLFMDELRKVIWPRTTSEEECLPSCTALELHWKRCTWVLAVWRQALSATMHVPNPARHGWSTSASGEVTVEWDTEESIGAVQALVDSLTSGCRCKTGCATKRCKCAKAARRCCIGCHCSNCNNSEQTGQTQRSHPEPVEDTGTESDEGNEDHSSTEVSDIDA